MRLTVEETKEVLLKLIMTKKEDMNMVANKNGISSNETLECSQELDELLVQYQKLHKN